MVTVEQEIFDGARFHKMPPNLSEELFIVYIFAKQTCNAWTTPLAVDCHAPHMNLVEVWSEHYSFVL